MHYICHHCEHVKCPCGVFTFASL